MSLWGAPIRLASILSVAAYLRATYRIRRWGRLPRRRGATLVVANHQHDLDDMTLVSALTLDGAWLEPICTVSSRRLFEPGFLALRLPIFEPCLRRYNPAPLFGIIGMQPIENQLAVRSVASISWMLYQRGGDFRLQDAFSDATVQRLGIHDVLASRTNSAEWFRRLQANAKISELREPIRSEALALMRAQVEADFIHIEGMLKDGATFYLAPEGRHTTDGRMLRFRGAYARLAPHAQIYVAPISYDPFAPGRFSMLYRIIRCDDSERIEAQLRAQRPVTLSQLLAQFLNQQSGAFSASRAAAGVQEHMNRLPRRLFVDPELQADPPARVRAALTSMARRGFLRRDDAQYARTQLKTHPEFPEVDDIFEYQINFLHETLAAVST